MRVTASDLSQRLQQQLGDRLQAVVVCHDEVTIEVAADNLIAVATTLRDHADLHFAQLTDVCGVDYLHYGQAEWDTTRVTGNGFDRAVERDHLEQVIAWHKPRFAVVYHLLSFTHNCRLRLRCFLAADGDLMIDSVVDIWPAANWFEREAFDLYGILFRGHPDLRRLLTDYGFIGHPFRKDFPVSGEVEVRYDAATARVVYEPVDIEPRVLVPKVIRQGEEQHG